MKRHVLQLGTEFFIFEVKSNCRVFVRCKEEGKNQWTEEMSKGKARKFWANLRDSGAEVC